jgi:molybdenum cofactor biosynthesis protein B
MSPVEQGRVPAEHRQAAPRVLGFAVVTVSSSRTPADDTSGELARRLVEDGGHRCDERLLVPDDVAAIRGAVEVLLRRDEIDVVVTSGGTGFSPQDLTPEAVEPLLERQVPGFAELFRSLSFAEVGAAAMLSRALAGIARGKAVFALPGSPAAVRLAMERLVLPEAGHLLGQARRRR